MCPANARLFYIALKPITIQDMLWNANLIVDVTQRGIVPYSRCVPQELCCALKFLHINLPQIPFRGEAKHHRLRVSVRQPVLSNTLKCGSHVSNTITTLCCSGCDARCLCPDAERLRAKPFKIERWTSQKVRL